MAKGAATATPAVKPELKPAEPRGIAEAHIVHGTLRTGVVLQNRYRILEVLGVGGMSTVYRARDLRFTSVDRSCAVKEMFNSADDPKLRQIRFSNFQREAAILATLTHSAIPRIYDYFEQQGTIYLILEIIHGQDLETMLTKRGAPFDESQVIEWAIRLCDVLAYLHDQSPEPVIFRDMKPSNVMIRAEDGHLMLVDFGIARSFAPEQKGTMIGTEGYAPPEQYRGIANPRGDIYALGATMHHLSTGSDPRMETPFTFAERPPRKLNTMLTQEFEEIVLRCVAYDPSERYGSVAEVRGALEALRAKPITTELPLPVPTPAPAAKPPSVIRLETAPLVAKVETSLLVGKRETAPLVTPTPAKPQPDRLSWRLKTDDEVRGSASYAGGAVYAGSYDRKLYAIDETDGSVRWTFTAQRGIVSRPAPIGDMVVFGSEDANIYAVSRANGRLLWTFRTNMAVRSSPLAHDDWCCIGSDDGFLYKLDRRNGTAIWRLKTWGPVRSTPVAADASIVFGSDDGFLYSIQSEGAQLNWRTRIGAPIMSTPAVARSTVVFGASDGFIRGASLKDGRVTWQHKAAKTVIASPEIDEKHAYVASADGHMYALEIETGALIWKTQICRQVTSSATIDGDVLYVGGNDASVSCLSLATGEIVWRYLTAGAVVAKPLVTHEHIIFGSLDSSIYALARGV
jgi:serine/threonine protein kinase